MGIGAIIEQARLKRHISRRRMVEQLQQSGSGVTERTLWAYEKGHSNVPSDILFTLCQLLEVDIAKMFHEFKKGGKNGK